jgi:enoyl-CoA hydratase
MTDYSNFQHLDVTNAAGIAVVRFDPQEGGELSQSIFADISTIFAALMADGSVDAAVLTGPEGHFFAGGGRTRTARVVEAGLETLANQILIQQQSAAQIASFRKPLVAAVNGRAHNHGAVLALLCDAAVASSGATFGDDHLELGVAAGDGGTMLWPLLVGLPLARQILLGGRSLTAAQAYELGLVTKVVEPAETVDAAVELARRLAALPRLPYVATKLALNNWCRLASIVSWDMALAFEATTVLEPKFRSILPGAAGADGEST